MDTKNQAHFPVPNAVLGDPNNPAIRAAADLVRVQNELGLSLSLRDANFNTIAARFNSMTDLLNSPEFISHLTQDFYISDGSDTQWFMMRLKKGRFSSITFLLMMKIYWVKIINKAASGFDFVVVAYSPGEKEAGVKIAVVPQSGFSPEKIAKYFSGVIGENANDLKEIGKVICFILAKHISNPAKDSLVFISFRQGFQRFWGGKSISGTVQFNPPRLLPTALLPYLSPALQSRQYPVCDNENNEDMTPILEPLFSGKKWLLIALLIRKESWLQFLFAKLDIYADNIVTVKPTLTFPISFLIAIFKNTSYDSLEAPPIGPNIKPLRFDLEAVNDGVIVVVDTFAADQMTKAEKGYDLLIQDVCGAAGRSSGVHHIIALISEYADLYLPHDKCCVLELGDTETAYSPSDFKIALKRLDANLIRRIERGCNGGNLEKVFNCHVDEVRKNIPDAIPVSKRNTYVMLVTALRMYRDTIVDLYALNKETGENEPVVLRGRVVDFVDTPFYDRFLQEYGDDSKLDSPNAADAV